MFTEIYGVYNSVRIMYSDSLLVIYHKYKLMTNTSIIGNVLYNIYNSLIGIQ